ncbi:hypothetical protein RN001_008135 [Aquatica leii]|uniref:Uncharacterized protein n=1 Tax=Aquatica leii TaxID=1421715 RepID=A0AAN7SH54_9COLE|nr:hypothetical protein RN001_008135 [Aquatica leii]
MVVPFSNETSLKSKNYIGNHLTINVTKHNSRSQIIGNNCKININENNGRLKIIGNSCSVYVSHGDGEIVYNGNNGRIHLGPNSNTDNVTYVGNGGKIIKDGISSTIPNNNSEVTDAGKTKNKCLNVVNVSHKHFLASPSLYSISIPQFNITTGSTKCVVKITNTKKR